MSVAFIFYSHRFDPETLLEETIGALDATGRQGKALFVGISSYTGERTDEATRVLRELGTLLLIDQSSYSMLTAGSRTTYSRSGTGRASAASLSRRLSSSTTTSARWRFDFSGEELAAIERHAVGSGVNLWAASSGV